MLVLEERSDLRSAVSSLFLLPLLSLVMINTSRMEEEGEKIESGREGEEGIRLVSWRQHIIALFILDVWFRRQFNTCCAEAVRWRIISDPPVNVFHQLIGINYVCSLLRTEPALTPHTSVCPWTCVVAAFKRLGFYNCDKMLSSWWKSGTSWDEGCKGSKRALSPAGGGECIYTSLPFSLFLPIPSSLLFLILLQ